NAEAAVSLRTLQEACCAMPADIVEGADRAIVAAHDKDRLAEKIEGVKVARPGNVVQMADELPRRTENPLRLVREEVLIAVEPGRQARELVRVDVFDGRGRSAVAYNPVHGARIQESLTYLNRRICSRDGVEPGNGCCIRSR